MQDYPVKLGMMLFTLVDPHKGHEVAYNRWYERDHFYGGCMIGPGILAGARWVSTREYKDLRFTGAGEFDSPVAEPIDAGSFLATYFVQKGHEGEHFGWATPQVFKLYEAGRGFDEREHAHTVLYSHRGEFSRDVDGVPVELALDHRFAGLVSIHVDRAEGVGYTQFAEWLDTEGRSILLDADSPVAIVAASSPVIPKPGEGEAPMKLGTGPGTPQRTMLLAFLDDAPKAHLDRFRTFVDALEASGLARVVLVAPFIPTIPGTDTYTDQLW
ncbi:MAG: hypothetical protein GX868_05205 [Actinobacteria bacterium]|nr:hypothetical protein [Actinomycetota bacterium]